MSAIIEALERLEFCDVSGTGYQCCKVCQGINPVRRGPHARRPEAKAVGHREGCVVARALVEARKQRSVETGEGCSVETGTISPQSKKP